MTLPRFSGVGSWPNLGSREAVRIVRDLTVSEAPDSLGIPYLPEEPTRGPGADMIGRAAGLLVEMSAQLEPSGWRLSEARGIDMRRASSYLTQDVDELAEAYEGYSGPLKISVCGPVTLAACLWLPRGDQVVSDFGAVRDLAQSLASGVRQHVAHVARLVPSASLTLQVDEPMLPAVMAGSLKSASGWRQIRALDKVSVRDVLSRFVDDVREDGVKVSAHSCAANVPLGLLRQAGFDALGVDFSLIHESQYDELGEAIDDGLGLWAGVVPTQGATNPRDAVATFDRVWGRLGFGASELGQVVVTPTCGLAGLSPRDAVETQRRAGQAAALLAERV